MESKDDRYAMSSPAFYIINDFSMSNDESTLYAAFTIYSQYYKYYKIWFFDINTTEISAPSSVRNAPLWSVSLP